MFRRAIALTALLAASASLAASPIPEFPKDGTVAVSDVPDDFDGLRAFLRSFESQVGAKYHVAIVRLSDALDRPGPDFGDAPEYRYTDSIANAWAPKLDKENAIFILLAIENRDIAAHPYARWTRLGWERSQVKETIDRSSFGQYARAGDYGGAVEVLIRDIDGELAGRLARSAEEWKWVKQMVVSVGARLDAYPERVRITGYNPASGETLKQQAADLYAGAKRAIDADDLGSAKSRLTDASALLYSAEEAIASLVSEEKRARKLVPEVRETLNALERAVAAASFDTTFARERLAAAQSHLDEAIEHLGTHQPDVASLLVERAKEEGSQAENAFDSAQRRHTFVSRTLPAVAGVLALLVALVVLMSARGRSRRRRNEAAQLVDEWEALLRTAGGNVVNLLDEHALILGQPDLATRFTGHTVAPVQAAAEKVDDLLLLYDCGQRLLAQARAQLSQRGLLQQFSEKPWSRVLALLTTEEVVARTQDVKERALFLPAQRETKVRPQALLRQMEAAYRTAREEVSRVESQLKRCWAEIDELRAAAARLERSQEALSPFAPSSPFQKDVDAVEATCVRLHEEGQADPVGKAAEAAAFTEQLAQVAQRIDRALQAAKRVHEAVRQKRDDARALLKTLRSEGMLVLGPGFDPELLLARIEAAGRTALDAVRTGADSEAQRASTEAHHTAAQLCELLSRTRASKAESPARLLQTRTRLAALKQRLPERTKRLEQLRERHADSALQPALDNVEEATPVLAQAEQCLTTAHEALGSQWYLAAAEQLERAQQLLTAVDALYTEIDTRASELDARRDQAKRALQEATSARERLSQLLKNGDAFAAAQTLQDATALADDLGALGPAMAASRPDWMELSAVAQHLAQLGRQTAIKVEQERTAHREATALITDLKSRRSAYANLLNTRTDDREETNAQLKDASAQLDVALALSAAARPDWPSVLAGLKKAASGLELTKEMAEKDFAEAAEVRKAVAKADKAVRKARGQYYRHGIEPDLSQAEGDLAFATRLLAEHHYARARHAAEKAVREANDARVDAEYRESRADNASAGGAWQFDSSGSSSDNSSSLFGSSSSFGSSSGSSFGSSSGSSFGSSSGGSSFGSSSGGSSFGSSSSGSSFGSSTGGSKW